ncbi:MAG: hypothetical protein KDC53_04230, partial [Saprospiraceae bacterium]|nr:hypothetical protein [Saprospiraceae bacterium]
MRILLRNAFLFYILISTVFAQTNLDTLDIRIKAITGMQYDQVRFRVEPGRYVRLILENTDEMEHNLVIGKKGAREEIIAAALALGAEGPDRGYIPSIPAVMYSIRLLRGGESDSIIFRAPLSTGVFPYVCTFPGHGTLMYGAMYVTNGVLPKLEIDDHVPLHRRKQEQNEKGPQKLHHPYRLLPPYLYRVLVPDAGPAAIAVALPDQINYCW